MTEEEKTETTKKEDEIKPKKGKMFGDPVVIAE